MDEPVTIDIAPAPPGRIRADRIRWGETGGSVGVDPREWSGHVGRAFWLDGMAFVATSLTWPPGTLTMESLLAVLDRSYLLGVTALTWPTHDSPVFRDCGVNDIGYVPARWGSWL